MIKELEARRVQGKPWIAYEAKYKNGGQVPEVLKGEWSNLRLLTSAIDSYLNSRDADNGKKSKSRRNPAKSGADVGS